MNKDLKYAIKIVTDATGAIRDVRDFKLEIDSVSSAISQLAPSIGLASIVGVVTSATNAYERQSNTIKGLAAVARYSGVEIGASMKQAADEAADGLINVESASKSLQNLLSRGFSLQESTDIVDRLKDAAAFNRQANLTMSEAVVSATEGLKNENSVLVDNAGVTKNVAQMWKEYAAQIGVSATALTQAQKRQAEYNGIMQETEAQVGNAKLAVEGLTGTKARLRTEIEKVQVAFGAGLEPTAIAIGKAFVWVTQVVGEFIGGIEIAGAKAAMFVEKTKSLASWAAGGGKWSDRPWAAGNDFGKQEALLAEQAQEIVDRWSGMFKAPELGRDTGKRRTEAAATADTKAIDKAAREYKKRIEEMIKSAEGFTSAWEQQAAERYEVQSRSLQAIVDIEEATVKEIEDHWSEYAGFWEMQAAEREEVNERSMEALIEAEEAASRSMIDLSRRTADAMEQNFSDFFFDAITQKLDDLQDYSAAVFKSMARAVSDYMGQVMKEWLTESASTETEESGSGDSGTSSEVSGIFDRVKNYAKIMFGGLATNITSYIGQMVKSLAGGIGSIFNGSLFGSIGSWFGGLFGGGGVSGIMEMGDLIGGLVPFAQGNVFAGPGIAAYRNQVITRPTIFAFAQGGIMGEGGRPEAVMPLVRMPGGDLGVQAGGRSKHEVIVNNYYASGARATATTSEDGMTTVIAIEQLERGVMSRMNNGSGLRPYLDANYVRRR